MENQDHFGQLAGESRAMNFMVMTLIATHPDPKALQRAFREASVEWIDELADHPSNRDGSAFHEALQGRLAMYGSVIDHTVQSLEG